MIGWLVGLLAPRVGEKFARPLAWALIVVVAIGLFFGAKALYDQSVIDDHDAKVNLDAAREDRKADNAAAERRLEDMARRDYETDQLMKAMRDAPKDPKIDDARERSLAFHRCLRLQQAARENGLQPPACV